MTASASTASKGPTTMPCGARPAASSSSTIAAAIDQHVVTPNTTYDDKGYAVIGGRVLHNALDKSYGVSTVTQILEHSANAGAVFVGQKLGAEQLHAYLRAFGFGSATGV